MGGNISPQAIVKAATSIGPVDKICTVFENQTVKTKAASDKHSCLVFTLRD